MAEFSVNSSEMTFKRLREFGDAWDRGDIAGST